MTLLKDNNYKEINVALLSLEADIKNKITNFDTSEIDKQLAEINNRIDKINAGGGNNSSAWEYIKGKISSDLGLTKDTYGGTAATILDYNRGTPIKVRWGGPGINSADWYPAFNADGSALEPIHGNNIRAGKIPIGAPSSLEDGCIWIER